MAIGVANGTITVTTGLVGTTFTVSGLSFAPVAGYVFHSGRLAVGMSEQDHRVGHGIFTGTTSRRSYSTQGDHAAAVMATDHVRRDDCVASRLSTSGASAGKLDVDAMLSDGFRLIVDEAFATDMHLSWKVWGGDASQAEIVDITEPAATGDQDIATSFALDTGVDDKAVIFLGNAAGAFGTVTGSALWMLGFAAGNTPANAVVMACDLDGADPSITYKYSLSGECIAQSNTADAVTSRASLTAWLSTGFRLNWLEVDGGVAWGTSALVIKGGRWEVGDILTSTGTTNQTETTTYDPKGLLFGSASNPLSTADVTETGFQAVMGAATGAASRSYESARSLDGNATADIAAASNTNAFWAMITGANASITEIADLVSLDTGGFTWVMDDASASGRFIAYLSCSDAPAAAARQQTFTLLGVGA